MIEMDLQFFGGRGASLGNGGGGGSLGGGTGGVSGNDVESTTSLISASGKRDEINQTLSVLRDVFQDYGIDVQDARIAKMKGAGKMALAYYDSNGNVAINENFFDSAKMDSAMDRCIKDGFHPSRGNKTGIESAMAHEMGHRLTDALAQQNGSKAWVGMDKTAKDIVKQATKNTGYKSAKDFASKISGYAGTSDAECIAEAFADVYCNGNRASRESHAIVNVLNNSLGRK